MIFKYRPIKCLAVQQDAREQYQLNTIYVYDPDMTIIGLLNTYHQMSVLS